MLHFPLFGWLWQGIRFVVVTAALALALCSVLSNAFRSNAIPALRPRSPTLAELDARSERHFRAASSQIPGIVGELASAKALTHICILMARDKLAHTHLTQEHLHKAIAPILTHCQAGAAVYQCRMDDAAFKRILMEIMDGYTDSILFAAGGLSLDAFFLKPALNVLWRVLGGTALKLAASWGTGAAIATADGPLPVLDVAGAALALGGTAWSAYAIYQAKQELSQALTVLLNQLVRQSREACRKAVVL